MLQVLLSIFLIIVLLKCFYFQKIERCNVEYTNGVMNKTQNAMKLIEETDSIKQKDNKKEWSKKKTKKRQARRKKN